MARSTYIYVVTYNGELRAAFTVKKEMNSWLYRNQNLISWNKVHRMRDGVGYGAKPPIEITTEITC